MHSDEWISMAAVGWTALGFTSYYFLSRQPILVRRSASITGVFNDADKQVLLQRFLGFFFLGLCPAVFLLILPEVRLSDYGFSLRFANALPWWSWALLPLILLISYFHAPHATNLDMYPQIRARKWSRKMIIISALTWILFLLGYEFLFRGFLLFASVKLMSPAMAICLNTALYALVHMYKGPKETLGSIPLGILLCYLTLHSGNFFFAFLLHSVMALSNEWFSLGFHPEMQRVR